MDKSPDSKIDYIAIRGIVKPLGEPLTSINNRKITGVIQKLKIKEHVVTRSTAGFWYIKLLVVIKYNENRVFIKSRIVLFPYI